MKKQGLLSNCAFLLQYAYETNRTFFFVKIPQMIVNIVTPFIPVVFIRLILNEITVGRSTEKLFLCVALFSAVSLLKDLSVSLLDRFVFEQTDITVRKIHNRLGQAVMEMKYSDVERPQIRDFIVRAQDGTSFMQVFEQLSGIISSFITAVGLAAIIISIQPIIFVFVALIVICRLISDKKNRELWEKWRPKYAPVMRKSNYLFRLMKSIEFGKEIRINNLRDWIYQKTDTSADEFLKMSKQHNIEIRRHDILTSVVSALQECAVYFILAYKVIFSAMPIGDFSMYVTSVNSFSDSVRAVVSGITSLMEIGLFVKDFRFCIEMKHDSFVKKAFSTDEIDKDNVVLEFADVSFRYPNTDRFILNHVSFVLKKGESLSVVGANGAGKTTLIKLICRLYEPTSGVILLNGTDIRNYSFEEYAGLIGAVFQDYRLLSFSVRENIALGKAADDAELCDCLQKCGLEKKIRELQNGLETSISKEFDSNGIELSGGESQKLAMARTLYKGAQIIIMDEPTSALDPIAEAEMYARFHDLTKDKAAIYISHRLSSCQFCDRTAVLNDGRFVQYGPHDELMKEDGYYREMWNMQARYYVETDTV